MIKTVKYQIATYKGTINVNCHPDDDNQVIINRAKNLLIRQYGSLPFGYESFKIITSS